MKLLAIDSNSILNRAFYGIKLLSNKNGDFTNAIFGYMNILFSMINEVKPDTVVCAFDLKAPTFRHKMYDGYKAQRKGMPEELAQQMPKMKEILKTMGYKILEIEGFEADDILGTLSKMCYENGDECVIATGDRDSLQLINDKVNVRLATTKMGKSESIIYNSDAVFEKYGVYPKDLIEVKALMGDTSDNIPGVMGIGEKTATALVAKYKNLENIYENIDDDFIKKGVRQKLIDDKENAYLSRTLGTICCDVPIDETLAEMMPKEMNKEKLKGILASLELNSMIKKLELDDVKADIPENKSQITKAQINYVYKNIADLKEINAEKHDKIYLDIDFSNDNLVENAVLLLDNEIIKIDFTHINQNDFIKFICDNSKKIITNSIKPLYKMALINALHCDTVKFDIEVGAYVLNPYGKDYSLESLCNEYNCDLQSGIEDFAKNIVRIFNLYNAMETLIKENNEENLANEIELPLTKVLATMEYYGFKMDSVGLKNFGDDIEKDINSLTEKIYDLAGEKFNINSPKQMGEILFEKLQLPSKKKTKTGYSTGAEILEGLIDKHPIISLILEYRKLAKIKSTYVDGFLKLIDEKGYIHTSFQQTETRTGRISSTEPNMQNIPVRTEIGANLRKFFITEEGRTLVDADYSQIELRVLAHMAKDENMTEAFLNGEDIHLNTAAQVFDLPPLFITPLMRSRAKAVNFGIVYGIGAFSLAKDINVSVSEADKYIKNYLHTFSGVKKFMDDTKEFAKTNGYVTTLYQRHLYIPELKSTNHFTKAFGERAAMNAPIQGSAADIIKLAMVKVFDRLNKENLDAKLILQVHDELIVDCPKENAEKIKAILKEEMENAIKLNVPLIADANIGDSWFEAK